MAASTLSFLIAVAYWPGFVGAATAPKWMLLSAVVPFLLRRFEWTAAHTWLTVFLGWCALSLFWTVSLYDGLDHLWHFILYGLIFCVGSSLKSLKGPLIAFALGVSVSSLMAPFQVPWIYEYINWRIPEWIVQAAPPAGLFMNRNYLAEAALLAAVGLLAARTWWPVPFLLPGLLLPGSMGVFASAALTGMTRLNRWLAGALIVLGAALLLAWFSWGPSGERSSFEHRKALYLNSLALVSPFGNGIGSYWATYPTVHDAVIPTPLEVYSFSVRPRTAHNDPLTLTAETGIVGLILFIGFCVCVLRRPREPGWYVFVTFLCLGLFNFPLYHTPASAFIAFLAAGCLCRCRHYVFLIDGRRGGAVRTGEDVADRGRGVPLVSPVGGGVAADVPHPAIGGDVLHAGEPQSPHRP